MNGLTLIPPSSNCPISRDQTITLLNTALSTGEVRYARRLSTAWLAIYPGDLQVSLYYARALFLDKAPSLQQQALPILEELCQIDPEFLEAQELLAEVRKSAGLANHYVAKACVSALTHGHITRAGKGGKLSSWAKYVHEARLALDRANLGDAQNLEKAECYIHQALIENPDTPLAAVVHLRLSVAKGTMPPLAIRSLAQIYHERWPSCLQFTLTLADSLIENGDSPQAVAMLHQAVSKDIAGQVPVRMWGIHHPYKSLWPICLEVDNIGPNTPQSIPIPAAIASSLGWNQLPATVPSACEIPTTPVKQTTLHTDAFPHAVKPAYVPHAPVKPKGSHTFSEPAQSVQIELERLAENLKRPHLAQEDGRFPIYVIFTTKQGLETNYGPQAIPLIDEELKKLSKVIRGHRINHEHWGALVFYADDPVYTQPFDLQPACYNDPWGLKLILADLDAALETRGERIGAILIVGGPEVVPFHNLPNPVEDADVDVPSDNPYATRDNNYFIVEWQVGRISGGSGNNPNSLLNIIREMTRRYAMDVKQLPWYRRLWVQFNKFIKSRSQNGHSSFGYTAAVWRRASLSVFRSIGDPRALLVSPPIHACDLQQTCTEEVPGVKEYADASTCLLIPSARLGYFNLHGVPDSVEWYGQRDPTEPGDGPDFPVAIRPQDIRNSGHAPHLVFSEACYGANISGKLVDEAISLKFLASGTQAVIGSTCISYGSLSTPLSAADLLGRVFWNLLEDGFTAGESLRRAKIHLTREMNRRQGFLDAEDQKTLISFVLYGDPLAQPYHPKHNPKSTPRLSDTQVQVPTVCERSAENEGHAPVSPDVIAHLKTLVAQYLPGMSDAHVSLSDEHQACSNLCSNCRTGKRCVLSQSISKNQVSIKSQRHVVTLSKSIEQAQHIHKQYARLTLDERGKLVKLVVSR